MAITPRILLVDDEEDILEFLSYNLNREGYEVETALNGEDGIEKAKTFQPHVIVLDIMMPQLDGVEVCEQLRGMPEFNDTIIVFLTARSESYTQVNALEMGGDDFIIKPIKPLVFKSRVRALLRRHAEFKAIAEEGKVGSFGDLVIKYDQYMVTEKGVSINLAKKEFDLLSLLASKPGRVFKRTEILSKVWGTEVLVGDRTIDVHIRKLREKIGSHYIHTMKGVGYKFDF